MPKQSDYPEYQELLDILRKAGQSQLELRNIEQTLNLPDASLRARIREGLERIGPVEKRQEQYCDYFFRFERGAEKLVVKQYSKGRLQVQGSAGDLYRDILEIVVPQYMLHYPQASVSVEQLLGASPVDRTVTSSDSDSMAKSPTQPSFPYIGTDESGKGDYFGPLVIAGVIVDEVTSERLKAAGVKDSKLLSDKRSRELAAQIREICKGKYQEVEIPPERYNELYEQFRRERKNLNHLLAWGHARAIESLLERAQCNNAVADQFGDESYISAKLMEKGKQIRLIQMPKAERFIAVAAASVLCRDRFLARLERISEEYGVSVPKGASEAVVVAAATILKKYGEAELRKTVKLHHRTTEKILKNDT